MQLSHPSPGPVSQSSHSSPLLTLPLLLQELATWRKHHRKMHQSIAAELFVLLDLDSVAVKLNIYTLLNSDGAFHLAHTMQTVAAAHGNAWFFFFFVNDFFFFFYRPVGGTPILIRYATGVDQILIGCQNYQQLPRYWYALLPGVAQFLIECQKWGRPINLK